MKIFHNIWGLLTVTVLSGCATAGSTIATLNEQSIELQRQLDREHGIAKNYEMERQQLDSRIALLRNKEKQLSQSSEPSDRLELIEVRNAIRKYEQQQRSRIATHES